MHPALRAFLSVVLASVGALVLAFVLSPDPTGLTPVLLGVVLTAVFAPLLYVGFGRAGASDDATG